MTRVLPRGGFTLLELLVAALLSAIIAGAVLTVLDTARRARTRLEEGSTRRLAAGHALDQIAADLAGAVATGTAQDSGFLGNDDSAGDLALDRLEFLTLAGRPDRRTTEPESDFRVVRWSIEPDPEASASGLVREELSILTSTSIFGEDTFVARTAGEDVAELDLEYFDGSAWQTSWDSNVSEGLPKAVRVQIAFADDETRYGRVVALRISRDFQSSSGGGEGE